MQPVETLKYAVLGGNFPKYLPSNFKGQGNVQHTLVIISGTEVAWVKGRSFSPQIVLGEFEVSKNKIKLTVFITLWW